MVQNESLAYERNKECGMHSDDKKITVTVDLDGAESLQTLLVSLRYYELDCSLREEKEKKDPEVDQTVLNRISSELNPGPSADMIPYSSGPYSRLCRNSFKT